MNESRFRSLMGEAIGNEPSPAWLAASVRSRLLAPPTRSIPMHLMVAVATAAVLLLGGLVGVRWLAAGPARVIVPAATPSAGPSPNLITVDPTNCRLPVLVERGAGPPSQLSAEFGFMSTLTGRFTRDASASVAGLPRSEPYYQPGTIAPVVYSPALRRWLPINEIGLAPDGRSYAWIRTLPVGVPFPKYTSAELHRYDVAGAVDHLLWSHPGGLAIQRWDSNGILVDGGPVGPVGSEGLEGGGGRTAGFVVGGRPGVRSRGQDRCAEATVSTLQAAPW